MIVSTYSSHSVNVLEYLFIVSEREMTWLEDIRPTLIQIFEMLAESHFRTLRG